MTTTATAHVWCPSCGARPGVDCSPFCPTQLPTDDQLERDDPWSHAPLLDPNPNEQTL